MEVWEIGKVVVRHGVFETANSLCSAGPLAASGRMHKE